MKVSLKEYARIHNMNHSTVRSYVRRGKLHIIDSDYRYTYVDSEEKVTKESYVRTVGKQPALCNILRQMKSRCYNQNNPRYASYGGRGIAICDEWKNDTKEFVIWALNNGYHEGLTIDRIDADGNYCPENCQWLTRSENSKKKKADNLKKKKFV